MTELLAVAPGLKVLATSRPAWGSTASMSSLFSLSACPISSIHLP